LQRRACFVWNIDVEDAAVRQEPPRLLEQTHRRIDMLEYTGQQHQVK
jgi:hypothetical protein